MPCTRREASNQTDFSNSSADRNTSDANNSNNASNCSEPEEAGTPAAAHSFFEEIHNLMPLIVYYL
jgi:hypothetical protein